jgi:hypothetical protein
MRQSRPCSVRIAFASRPLFLPLTVGVPTGAGRGRPGPAVPRASPPFHDATPVQHQDFVHPLHPHQTVADPDHRSPPGPGGAATPRPPAPSPGPGGQWVRPLTGSGPPAGGGRPGRWRPAAARPPRVVRPARPGRVSYPWGSRDTTSSSPAAWTASSSSSGVASGRARSKFSRRVALKTSTRWGTTTKKDRTASDGRAFSGTPPRRISPRSGSQNRSRRWASVLFPAPLGPTMATFFPAGTRNDTPSSAGRVAPGYVKVSPSTFRLASWGRGAGWAGSRTGGGESASSRSRPAAVRTLSQVCAA